MKFLSIRIILLVPIAVFGAGFLFIDSVQAQPPDNLVVQFETAPLFNKTNFLPDDAVSRWVKVTNNSGESRRIATEAINKSDPDDFASQLNLTIKEGATVIFNDTLKKFFSQGETYLSDLANGTTAQYDFTIVFNSGSGNEYQLKSLGFDILVGFEGQEGGLPLPTPGGGANGGGGLPPGLTIQDESVRIAGIEETSITLIWNTSYLSSSQVIYGAEGENHILNLTDNAGAPPKYGYAHTTPEYDIIPKVISHSVTIYGLTPSTTYYYRAVSHASLAISREYSFTTLGVKEIGKIEGEVEVPPGEETLAGEEILAQGEITELPKELTGEKSSKEATEETMALQETEKKSFDKIFAAGGLLAAISAAPLNLTVILILAGVVIIGLLILRLTRKRKIKS